MRGVEFPCPKCRGVKSRVVSTHSQDDGVRVRARKCLECGHRWFTAQDPEYLVRRDSISWTGGVINGHGHKAELRESA